MQPTCHSLAILCLLLSPAIADEPPSFRNDVMPVLSRSGCNLGTCHGNQNGKGGLKLSLRGQSPKRDFTTLARALGGRRTNLLEPESSLLLQKPLASVPHMGGRRFDRDSAEHKILRDWIAGGLPADAENAPRLIELTVTPKLKTIVAPNETAQIVAMAKFHDGSTRDVTRLCVFEPSSLHVVVSPEGTASCERPETSSVTVRYQHLQQPVRLEFVPQRPGFSWNDPQSNNFIDKRVFAKLRRIKTNPSGICDDNTFVRRVYLDLTGLLPPADIAREFVASENSDKRMQLIDRLLDSREFNDFQTLRWADLLRVEEKTLDARGVEVFHNWIHESFEQRKPLNQFVAELIAARGSTYTQPPANFYRALRKPADRAEAAAQVFLGIRLQCAKCHNHPFDHWTQEDYYGWSNFFARIDYKVGKNKRRDKLDKHEFQGEQTVIISEKKKDVVNPDTGKSAGLRYLGDGGDTKDDKRDRLKRLSEWLTAPTNRRFAGTQANRIWFQLMGRGLVEPVDDFRSTNPASHPQLLEDLTDEFTRSGYDVRHLMRLIASSATYQLSSAENETNAGQFADFSHPEPRRLTAEQTVDAVTHALGAAVRFGGHPTGTKAVQLKGVRGGHRHSKPEMGDRFMLLFGKPTRLQTCECERSNSTTLAQTFEMVSGDLVNTLVSRSSTSFAKAIANGDDAKAVLDDLYWSALSRAPTGNEQRAAMAHIQASKRPLDGVQDVAWALLNSNEFLLRR